VRTTREEHDGGDVVRRSGMEAGGRDRDEEERRRPRQALQPGVHVLDPIGTEPSAVCGAVQLRRVLAVRLRDAARHAGGCGETSGPADAVRAAEFHVPGGRGAGLRKPPRVSDAPGGRQAGSVLQLDGQARGRAGSGAAVHAADAHGLVLGRHRPARQVPRDQGARRVQEPARHARSAGWALHCDEHERRGEGRAVQGSAVLQRRSIRRPSTCGTRRG